MTRIPVTNAPSQRLTIVLEAQTVILFLRFESLTDSWLLSIEREGVTILAGQRLVMGTNLLRAHNFGLGGIILFAADEPGRAPGRDDLVDRVAILHATEAEIAAVSA